MKQKKVISLLFSILIASSFFLNYDITAFAQNGPVGVMQISCGEYHTGILKKDGSLWMTGTNFGGQLGDGTTINRAIPVKVMENVAQVSCGKYHTGILKKDGSLWMTGDNDCGQLGDAPLIIERPQSR